MKTVLAAIAGAAALAGVAGQAQAAQSPEQRIAALERRVAVLAARPQAPAQTPAQVAALQRRATALERRVKTLETNLKKAQTDLTAARNVAAIGLVYSLCFTAVTADALSGTWNVVDQISTATQAGKVYFGPQPVVDDQESCQALQLTRTQAIPPTLGPFSALTALLEGRR
jgi:hypothetical protein